MRSIAVIPARGGSVRIPRKNIKDFMGKPIIAYSIQAAEASGLFSDIIVSTEDDEIAEVAQQYGANVLVRPKTLADSKTGTQEVMQHAAKLIDADLLCCIYPTSPLMDVTDLVVGHHAMRKPGTLFTFSVGLDPLHDAGQFYWGTRWAFLNGAPLISIYTTMVPIDKGRDCDINFQSDWHRAEEMYEQLYK